jgi:phosphoribosylformylglycinamidine synthase
MQAWRIEVRLKPGLPDPAAMAAAAALAGAGVRTGSIASRRGYLLGSELSREQTGRFAALVLADPVAEEFELLAPGEACKADRRRIVIQPLPGVTDPIAHSVQKALRDSQLPVVPAGSYRVLELECDDAPDALRAVALQALANEVIHEVLIDAWPASLPGPGKEPDPKVVPIPIEGLDDAGLLRLSEDGGLALSLDEMRAVQRHFAPLRRSPTRLELETIAQTWSEHCKHKTLRGRIRFEGRLIDGLLQQTIAHVTHTLDRPWCVSVFEDNAGVIEFDDEDCVCIKVETHNHPSAIEPFGGAGTGVGGVIRDVLGTGLGARPIASTDVFCLAPVDLAPRDVPEGCLHPLQILRGVVAGVRDYGNPMGIPTVNGAIHFDPDFVGNPLVYVGNLGLLPRRAARKQARAGDAIVALGGRTGRDGIHGATFSSLELHAGSETQSSGAVQIGDPITERKVMDAVLRARDQGLFTAITDCGAGGFSSAVGEMAEGLGADVELSRAPLKYQGLEPWEVWVSEAQERMVLAVPEPQVAALARICTEEDVEMTVLGRYTDSGRLTVRWNGVVHGDLDLGFLHGGLPHLERSAVYVAPRVQDPQLPPEDDCGAALLAVLGDLNVASREWVIRQYDHEVQAGSAGKPLVGPRDDGPADAAVLAPKLGSPRGLVLACGLNPRYSRIDPAAMAECALDEALRNVVAAGGDPERTAVLDNYCWGNTTNPQRLGELVRASEALRDLALAYHTPFVSGKDSLNNEYRAGERTIVIPGCILITALSVIPDVARTFTSALEREGNLLYLVGTTRRELGGSVYWKQKGALGASVPRVDAAHGKRVLDAVWRAMQSHAVVAAHDLSEGGLGAAAAEMAIGGRLGLELDLDLVPGAEALPRDEELLFSESQSRFLLEVPPERAVDVEANLRPVPHARLGRVVARPFVTFRRGQRPVLSIPLVDAVRAWKQPLDLERTLVLEGYK